MDRGRTQNQFPSNTGPAARTTTEAGPAASASLGMSSSVLSLLAEARDNDARTHSALASSGFHSTVRNPT